METDLLSLSIRTCWTPAVVNSHFSPVCPWLCVPSQKFSGIQFSCLRAAAELIEQVFVVQSNMCNLSAKLRSQRCPEAMVLDYYKLGVAVIF